MLRLVTSLASPAGPRARLTAFIFHRVLPEPDPLQPELPDVAGFEQSLDWIGAQFRVLDPRLACERLVAGGLPAPAAIPPFDAGHRDNPAPVAPVPPPPCRPLALLPGPRRPRGAVRFQPPTPPNSSPPPCCVGPPPRGAGALKA